MKKLIFLFISLGFLIPGYSFAATQDIHLEWAYDYQPVEGRTLAGYHLYKEGVKICANNTPADRAMDCEFESEDGTFDFTLTAFCTDGYESSHSAPYTFTLDSIAEPELIAAFATIPASLSGDTPFSVSFDASASTGNIASYIWSFGDNSSGSGSQISHTYSIAGTFTTTLTVTSVNGASNQESVTVIATAPPAAPVAVISPATFSGDVPLSVPFDGSSSTGAVSYAWFFGDGETAHSSQINHTFTAAGIFKTTLTVTNDQGFTNATDVTVTVNEVTPPENTPPIAVIGSTTTVGEAPLTVTFDGSGSSDADGAISSYQWNFGDGASGLGASITHTYTSLGSFTATLTVIDNMGTAASATATITAAEFQIELGELEIDHNWARVNFSNPFINPVVVAGPPSIIDSAPCAVRLKDITSTGFDIRIQEWEYQDGSHALETVAYLVLEQGSFTFDDGTTVEAGKFDSIDTEFKTVQFYTAFKTEPVVMTSIATFNEVDMVTGRLQNITNNNFAHKTQEQESSSNGHGNETVNYIAWEPSQNSMGGINVIVDKTADKVRSRWYTVDYIEQLSDLPIFLGTMQSQDGLDSSTIRYANKTNSEIQVMVEEEQSLDDETRHTSEIVGYLLFSAISAEVSDQSASQPLIAVITADITEGVAPLTVTFDGSESTDADGAIVSYQWNFGDGNTGTDITTNYIFPEVGLHSISLTVTDDQGETAQSELTISVQEVAPVQ